MQRIAPLDDARVVSWEERLEAQMVVSLQAVMDQIADRIAKIQVASAWLDAARIEVDIPLRALIAAVTTGPTGDDLPPPMSAEIAVPDPPITPEAIPETPALPPGQPYISPDDLASIAPLWQQQVAEQILPLVAQVFIDSAGNIRSQLLESVAPNVMVAMPRLGSAAAEQYLATARNSFDEVGDHLWETARAQMSQGFDAGESIPQIADRLRQSAGLTARQGVLVARTSVIEASNSGSLQMAQISGLQMQKEWIATPDLRTRPTHLAADGQRVDLNEPFIVGGFPAMFPAAPTLPPSERYRCRCVRPDTSVSGHFTAAMRRAFAGELIEVTCCSGQKLAATEDHPVLTRRGWVAIGSLKPGDGILRACRPVQPDAGVQPDVENAPATAEQVFDAAELSTRAGVGFTRVGVYLNRETDVPEGKIEIHVLDQEFALDRHAELLDGLRHLGIAESADEVGVSGSDSTGFGIEEANQVGFGRRPPISSDSLEDVAYSLPGDVELEGQLLDRSAGIVPGNQFVDVDGVVSRPANHAGLRVASHDSRALQAPVDGLYVQAEQRGDFFDGLAGLVEIDRVLNLDRIQFRGHVYDFQSDSRAFIANDFIVHNCSQGYVMPDRPKEIEPPLSPRLDQLPGTSGLAAEIAPVEEAFPKATGPDFDIPARGPTAPPGYVRPSLKAAKTPRELRRVWQDEVEAITGHPFYVDAMPRGISMVTAREYAEGTLQMFDRFPGAKMDRIHWFDDAQSKAYAQVRRGGHAIEFNMKYASETGRPKFLDARRRDAAGWDVGDTSWGVRNDTTGQGVVYHEFMHILDLENTRERIHGSLVPLLIREADREGVTDVVSLIERRVSSYAASTKGNMQELIAEAGADVMVNGAQASELSRGIFDLLQAEYRARGFALRTAPLDELAAEAEDLGEAFPKAAAPRALSSQTVAQLRALAKERGITVPAGTRKADLVKMLEGPPTPAAVAPAATIEAPPLSRAPLAYQARQVELREAAARPTLPDKSRRMQGQSAITTQVEHEGGSPTVTKDYTRQNETLAQGKRSADAEELGALVDDAIGLRAPTVIRTGPRSTEESFLEGQSGEEILPWPHTITDDLIISDDGRLIGLSDILVGESDRNAGNFIRLEDGRLASIDRGGAFQTPKLAGAQSPFAEIFASDGKWAKSIDIAPADLAVIRARLEALRPEFERLGRATWHKQVMARLAEVEKRADPAAAIRLAEARADLAAIRPLSGFESRAQHAASGERALRAASPRHALTALEENAVDEYGLEASFNINKALRSSNGDLTKLTRVKHGPIVEGLDSAVEPLTSDIIVYRNLAGEHLFDEATLAMDDLAGVTFTDFGFVSTSTSERRASSMVMRILAPKGSPAISGHGLESDEIVLARGQTFRIVKDYGKPHGTVRQVDVEIIPKAPTATATRAAQRAEVRARAAAITAQRGNAALLARIDELVQAKASKAVIRQELDPALREAEQLYAGADAATADALRAAVDSGEPAKIRAALTRQSKASGLTPIGKAGAKAKFDPATMEGVGGTAIPDGADVIVVRRGAKLAGIETPEKATVRLARAPSTAKTVAKGDFAGLTRVGEQLGGNPGGIFEAGDGSRWYVKAARNPEQLRSEALALDLYRASGLDVPDVVLGEGLGELGQGTQIASRIIEGAEADLRQRLADEAHRAQVQEGFAVDAWLGNRDVLGASLDNILTTAAGTPIRIEAGGALRFRALGEAKDFGPDVTELDTMRAAGRSAAKVFGDMTPEQIIASAERVRKVTPAKIKALVKKHKLDPELADTLIARRADILRRAEALAGPKPLTAREYAAKIKAAAKGGDALDAVPYSTTDRKFGPLYEPDAVDRYRLNPDVNEALRARYRGDAPGSPYIADIHEIDRVFDESRLTGDAELWRGPGSGRSIFGDSATWGDDLAGFEWSDPAYSSTSASKAVADRFTKDGGVRLRILAPKKSKAIQLSARPEGGAAGYADEAEVLLARGARYRVVKDRGWTEITHPTTHQKIRVRDLDVEVVVPDETPPLPWETK